METLHAGLELHSILGRRSGGTPTGAWQVVSTGLQPRRNWDFDWYRDSSISSRCGASGNLRRGVCDNILATQCSTRTCGSWYHSLTITQRRLWLPESRIESAYIHSKMPALSTDESDQTVSQSTEIYNGSVVSLPSHMCGPYWPTSERRGRIPVHTGSDLCVLTLDRTFFN